MVFRLCIVVALVWAFIGSTKARSEDEFDVCKWAHAVIIKDMGESKWNKFVSYADKRCEDSDVDRQVFVNRVIIDLEPDLSKLKDVKEFVAWLALYDEWNLELCSRVAKGLKPYEAEMRELSKEFSWDKLMKKIEEIRKKLKK